MKKIITILVLLIATNVFSQKDRVDIYKVKKQTVKSNITKSYNVTNMYLALRFKDNSMNLKEVQIIHKSLNKTEKYLVTSSKKSTEDDNYGQVYYTIKNVSDHKYSRIMLTFDYDNKSVRIIPDYDNKSFEYKLEDFRTIYK